MKASSRAASSAPVAPQPPVVSVTCSHSPPRIDSAFTVKVTQGETDGSVSLRSDVMCVLRHGVPLIGGVETHLGPVGYIGRPKYPSLQLTFRPDTQQFDLHAGDVIEVHLDRSKMVIDVNALVPAGTRFSIPAADPVTLSIQFAEDRMPQVKDAGQARPFGSIKQRWSLTALRQ